MAIPASGNESTQKPASIIDRDIPRIPLSNDHQPFVLRWLSSGGIRGWVLQCWKHTLEAPRKFIRWRDYLTYPAFLVELLRTSMTSNKLMVLYSYCNLLPLAGLIHQFDRSWLPVWYMIYPRAHTLQSPLVTQSMRLDMIWQQYPMGQSPVLRMRSLSSCPDWKKLSSRICNLAFFKESKDARQRRALRDQYCPDGSTHDRTTGSLV